MKYAIVIPDGCADDPQPSLGGKTPLQAARTPHMDRVAQTGVVGRADNVPRPLTPARDVATLSLFGYDPLAVYTGRAPLEAAAMGVRLGPRDWAVRCNLVTVEDGAMRDFTAGHITSEEGHQLIAALQLEGQHHLMIYHVRNRQWTEVSDRRVDWPTWTRDSKFIICKSDDFVMRYSISTGKFEPVAQIKPEELGGYGRWIGVGADGSLLRIRNRRHRRNKLHRRHANFLPHRNRGSRNRLHALDSRNSAPAFVRQFDSRHRPEAERANVVVEFRTAEPQSDLDRSHVARLRQNLRNGQ